MNTLEDVEALFRRLLQSGRFEGLPKNPDHLDTVLAVAAGGVARRRPHAEPEINEVLIDWLESVASDVDHVTLRRRMVDCGFLKRTTNGSRYFLNYGRVIEVLGDPTISVDVRAIIQDIAIEQERKAAYVRGVRYPDGNQHGPPQGRPLRVQPNRRRFAEE